MNYFSQQSARLSYRKLTRADIPAWTVFFINNDSLRFVGIDMTQKPEALAREWVEMQLKRYTEQGLGHLAAEIKETGEFIGVGGILPRELEGKSEYEIAYSLLPSCWGKGYGTELARQMKHYGARNIKAERWVSIIDKENIASINVAIKNGMKVLFETHYLGMEVAVYGVENKMERHDGEPS